MKYKFWETINGKIILMVIVTTMFTLAGVGYIANRQVELGFEQFIQNQENEFGIIKFGNGRFPSEIARIARHEEMTNEFKATVTRTIIISSILGLSFSIVVGSVISSHITDPLRKLKNAITDVSKNNYKIRAEEDGSAEIRELIIEFNKLTAELERIEKLRADLVSDVSHELMTPLTKLRGQLEGVIDNIYKPSKTHISKTLSNLTQLEYLVNKLQELTEIQAGKIKLDKQPIKLNKLVEDIISGHTGKEITFVVNIPADLTISADKNRLTEIFDNLISNAYKFTDSGKITISANGNEIKITDTGKGIPKEDLPYIFERFYRVDKSRSKDAGGLGLGLAIVKELVEAHGWTMKVTSKVNKGSTFRISY